MNSSRIRVKMCGMTRPEDVAHACALGVDAVGLIFYGQSTRAVSIDQAKILLQERTLFVDAVAVLVNPEASFVHQILQELPIQLLQFHGEESPEFCQQFNRPYIKAIHPHNAGDIQQALVRFAQAQALLFDTPSQTGRGGTGLCFDWSIIPKDLTKPYVLSGGLNEFNVIEALNESAPYAVDLCSGIEASPGVKDPIKMSRFIQALWGSK